MPGWHAPTSPPGGIYLFITVVIVTWPYAVCFGTEEHMLIWICLVLLIAIVLMLGIEQFMHRIGIRPADPESRSRGIGDLRDRLPQHRK